MAFHKRHKLTSLVIGIVLIAGTMLTVTAVCGNLTGRWSRFKGLEESRTLLKELPSVIGDWEADPEDDAVLSKSDIAMLEIENGYIVRKYKNSKNAATVNLMLIVGPTGKVVVHTPEICFGGRDYKKEDTRIKVEFPIADYSGSGATDDTFWKVRFTNQSISGGRIAFYYAVSSGNEWIASEDPRAALQRFRYVYKLQIQAFEDGDNDNVKAFLTDCLPVIHRHIKQYQ
ncbi:hypothetical protein FACS1894214_2490 [Planctomycetales bacterium]|nr:hypothetical protein FACS1894214_2490 [Planctomycetales bacterium]